jgi:hypothetical protein
MTLPFIAKKELASTNQKPEDEWRRKAPLFIFWFYVLSKPCFAIF